MNNTHHLPILVPMMRALYEEDEAASPVDGSRFDSNVRFILSHPSSGQILLFGLDNAVRGYAILIPYWSNEFGGNLLFIDELYIVPENRNQGIGRLFFSFLDEVRPFDAVALALEVSPHNERARRLYESLGFNERRNSILTRPFIDAQSRR
jgi:ribosomal protein S18 acetylase RimI-like enzyme